MIFKKYFFVWFRVGNPTESSRKAIMIPPSKVSKDVNLCEVANFQGNALNFYVFFFQIFVFATNHHFTLLCWFEVYMY